MDGYLDQELINRILNMQKLFDNQTDLNQKISDVAAEMIALPEIPENIEIWIDSISEVDDGFKLADFKRMLKINKKYNELLEHRSENSSKIKVLIIDNLLDRINSIIK